MGIPAVARSIIVSRAGRAYLRGCLIGAALCLAPCAAAQEGEHPPGSDADLAQKLANPVSSMTTLPLQWNYDCCYGASDAARLTLNVQPVIPFKLNDDLNLVVRTIIPVIYQQSPAPGVGSSSGMSDITQSFFFVPASKDGVTWGVGPVFLYPTGGDDLGTEKWAAGPTALVLKQDKGWTYGALVNHLWSFAGESDRDEVNQTFLQPFISYNTRAATTYSLNTESSYNWTTRTWSVPVNVSVSQLYTFGKQRVSVAAGAKIYLTDEVGAPDWGLRVTATFLFPN